MKICDLTFKEDTHSYFLGDLPIPSVSEIIRPIYQKVYGNIVLYSGSDNKLFSIKAFIRNLLEEYDAIDIDDFMDDVYEKYGIKIPAKYDVTSAVLGTEMYYDGIMNKIYSNKALYYSDLDD